MTAATATPAQIRKVRRGEEGDGEEEGEGDIRVRSPEVPWGRGSGSGGSGGSGGCGKGGSGRWVNRFS
ncbi:hypothetical protein Sxan_57970 [Streptomyces xanthophaeus]|uniref:Uncharacterized protein n=1 Tax=Streptomyces xanthophaeus TaxID=67385 RepID=A0A919H898_9ACTN|nr:hypothetical protein Sxan_57970 [Streptomyces xanthophaeus]